MFGGLSALTGETMEVVEIIEWVCCCWEAGV